MKQRFSSLDVKIIVHELSNSLVSLRLANVYDLSTRIFLLKFAKPEHKEQLVIDSGFRCHLTAFSRATAAAPSPFVARLRKFLRTRRVTSVSQVGTDRIIDITFSDGQYRLFLEFYAGGNIVLTDSDLTILALLRNVSEGAEHEQYRLGSKYDLSLRQNYEGVPALTKQRIRDGLQKALDRQKQDAQKPGKKIKKKGGDQLRKALAVTTTEFPPVLIDHALQVTGFDRETLPEQVLESEELLDNLLKALEEAQKVVNDITSTDVAKGYIMAKRSGKEQPVADGEEQDNRKGLLYDDFHPFKPSQYASDESLTFLEYDGFNKAVDDFFSSIEGQKLESRLTEREENAKKRIDQAKQEQAKRLDGLQQVQDLNVDKAQAIEANVERVEEAVAAVNGLVAQGMDWADIGQLIDNEKSRGNGVAEMIKLPLKLHENTVTLLLSGYENMIEDDMADLTESEPSDSEAEDTPAPTKKPSKPEEKRLAIDIDLSLSPWANARQYYDQRRTAAVKQGRTAEASEKALRSTEQKVMADLKKGLKQEKEVLRPVRKQMWFEKFVYFISSDGYLVLAGRDAQQNEMLYRRYLRKGDIYVHADLHGAASVIIKNNPKTPEAPIPPSTLSQAGNLAVCTSSAWDSKAVMSAWWVNADQVTKTAPTGEYLALGGFVIKGKKNFLPPAQLLLGFAIVFQITEESKARHLKHRHKQAPEVPETPDLTDAETLAETSAGGEDGSDDDDEFPDATRGTDGEEDEPTTPMPQVHVHEDSDDDLPDAPHDYANSTSEDEGEERREAPRSNPLQMDKEAESDDDQDDEDAEAQPQEDSAGDADDDAPRRASLDAPASDGKASAKTDKQKQQNGQTAPSQAKATSKPAQPTRGKRGKAKKIAAKYADQDDEDRELAMKLLGHKTGEERKQAQQDQQATKTESAEAARARRRAQHDKTQKEGLMAEELRRHHLEEGIEDLTMEESAQLSSLDTLVGTPLPGDEILEAMPVCAPWAALGKHKYKAKLQPGSQKKGKAIREILFNWGKHAGDAKKVDQKSEDVERIWPREAELIKGLKEVEVVGILPVKSVRVVMAGGADGAKGGKGGKGNRGGRGSKKR